MADFYCLHVILNALQSRYLPIRIEWHIYTFKLTEISIDIYMEKKEKKNKGYVKWFDIFHNVSLFVNEILFGKNEASRFSILFFFVHFCVYSVSG